MKHHTMTLFKRACTLLFWLCLLASNEAYAACEDGSFEYQFKNDPIELMHIYSLPHHCNKPEIDAGYLFDVEPQVYTLFKEKRNNIRIYLLISFLPDKPLFADGFLFHADRFNVMEIRDIDFVRDDGMEYYRLFLTDDEVAALRKVALSKKTILRLYGKHQHKDLEVTANQKQAMRLMLEKYDELKGKQP